MIYSLADRFSSSRSYNSFTIRSLGREQLNSSPSPIHNPLLLIGRRSREGGRSLLEMWRSPPSGRLIEKAITWILLLVIQHNTTLNCTNFWLLLYDHLRSHFPSRCRRPPAINTHAIVCCLIPSAAVAVVALRSWLWWFADCGNTTRSGITRGLNSVIVQWLWLLLVHWSSASWLV